MEPDVPELIYDGSCPYCLAIARTVDTLDVRDRIRTTDIHSERGRALVESHHNGEFVDSPHLFGEKYVYYGVRPVARAVGVALPKSYAGRV